MKWPIDELFEHGLYGESALTFERHRKQQIINGFTEYGQTYDPKKFTADEQIEHFMSELPDIMHYGYGMYKTIKYQEVEIADLKKQLKEAREEIQRMEMWKNG